MDPWAAYNWLAEEASAAYGAASDLAAEESAWAQSAASSAWATATAPITAAQDAAERAAKAAEDAAETLHEDLRDLAGGAKDIGETAGIAVVAGAVLATFAAVAILTSGNVNKTVRRGLGLARVRVG